MKVKEAEYIGTGCLLLWHQWCKSCM